MNKGKLKVQSPYTCLQKASISSWRRLCIEKKDALRVAQFSDSGGCRGNAASGCNKTNLRQKRERKHSIAKVSNGVGELKESAINLHVPDHELAGRVQ